MTRDDIIRMAREAGFGFMTEKPKSATHMQCGIDDLERFAALVAAAEREACAKVCDDVNNEYDGEEVSASWIAAAIRARGNT